MATQYLKVANRRNAEDGTTAVTVLARGDSFFVAHAGDSRAVLVHSEGKVTVLTSDHKPNRPDERKRIRDLGGSVVFWGVWRVEGILAVSRAIGDRMLKPFVVAEPEVKEFKRSSNDHFIVVASDGLWDTITNEDAGQITMRFDDPQAAAMHLMEEAYARGSLDNICVMVIDLRACVICIWTTSSDVVSALMCSRGSTEPRRHVQQRRNNPRAMATFGNQMDRCRRESSYMSTWQALIGNTARN